MTKQPIPSAALDKHTALLGMTGSGKTSAGKSGIVEPDLEAGRRVIVIDPTSSWWGLRLRRDAKSKGFTIYIFGGDHGDYPLKAANARLLAETFATSSDSAIFDTSQMTVAERTTFFTEFAETFRRKNKGWVRFVIDEAHLFMPQQGAKAGGGVPAMLHAANNLVSLGRSRGLRIVLISQRAAKVHKDSLTQCHSLVAMQLISPQDRNAIKDWVEDQADPVKGKEIIASLPTLAPGEAWVWSPQVQYLERVKFARPHTFDSSSAPEDNAGEGPQLAPINLDTLKQRLVSVEAEVKANDPKVLRGQITELKGTITTLERDLTYKSTAPAADQQTVDKAMQRGFEDAKAKLIDHFAGEHRAKQLALLNDLSDALIPTQDLLARISKAVGSINGIAKQAKAAVHYTPAPMAAVPRPVTNGATHPPVVRTVKAVPIPIGDGTLTSPQQRVLRSLAMWRALGHEQPSREMVAAVAGYKPSTGNYNNLIGGLVTAGLVGKPMQGHLSLLAENVEVIDKAEARTILLDTLNGPQRKLIDVLRESGALSRDDLAGAAGYQPSTGNFNNLIGSLNTIGVTCKPQVGQVSLSDWAQELFQ